MTRLNPAAPRRPDSHLHLPLEQPRAMTVAVDGQRHTGGDCLASALAFEVEMRRGAVHFERGSRFHGGGEYRIEVQRVAITPAHEPIGWMRNDVDERVMDRLQAAPRQRLAILTRGIVQRCEDDIERFEDTVGEIQVPSGMMSVSTPCRIVICGYLSRKARSRPADVTDRGVSGFVTRRPAPNDR